MSMTPDQQAIVQCATAAFTAVAAVCGVMNHVTNNQTKQLVKDSLIPKEPSNG